MQEEMNVQAPPQDETSAALAELEAEREKQIGWRVAVTRAARVMKNEDGEPCTRGINDWLRDRQVPGIGGENDTFSEDRVRREAVSFLPPQENPEFYSAAGIRGKLLLELRAAGERWLASMLEDLRRLPPYEDVSRRRVDALIAELTGVPAARPVKRLAIVAEFAVTIPADSLVSEITDAELQTVTQSVLTSILQRGVSGGGQVPAGTDFDGDIRIRAEVTGN